MKQINLTQNKIAIIDDEIYNEVSKFKWCVRECMGKFYACKAERRAYANGKVTRKYTYLHRFILGVNELDKIFVDHINGNTLDNRKLNLRLATHAQNISNQIHKKISSSKYKGVYLYKSGKYIRWVSAIRSNNISYRLGYFKDEKVAAQRYNNAALVLHGEFANLNIIDS